MRRARPASFSFRARKKRKELRPRRGGPQVPEDKREVAPSEAEALAEEYGVKYYEASAKKNVNVATAFEELAAKIVRRKLAASGDGGGQGGGGAATNLVLSPDEAKPKKCACG